MNAKYFLYIFVSIIVIWTMEAININHIFKKNRVMQARVFYVLLSLAMIYLITNFIFDFVSVSKMI